MMEWITGSWFINILLALVSLLLLGYYYLTATHNYWKNRNVPFNKPALFFGIFSETFLKKRAFVDIIDNIYNEFKNERFCGYYAFRKPTLMIRDPKLIEQILIKDFSYFEDRGTIFDEENEPLTVNLINLTGDRWRSLRHKLTPTFTSGKLKGMFEQMSTCGEGFLKTVEEYAKTGEEVETGPLMSAFSTNIIGNCAFGIEIKRGSVEAKRFKEMVDKAFVNNISLRFLLKFFYPKLAAFFGVLSIDPVASDYFMGITKATLQHRLQNNVKRNDFFQLLLTLKQQDEMGNQSNLTVDKEAIDKEDIQLQYTDRAAPITNNFKFTEEMIAAQLFVFLAAGSESTSTTMSTVLHYLAEYPEVQHRLQEEVDSVLAKHNGQWTYKTLKDMTYLDQVIQEAQRLFSIATIGARVCTSPYKIPDTDIVIEKGTPIVIPIVSLHKDPKYYPNPEVFDPDRFAGNNFKPSPVYQPFGDGPRICIAMRFAILEMKVLIARLLSKFSMQQSSKTLTPLRYDPKTFSANVLGGVWVTFEARTP